MSVKAFVQMLAAVLVFLFALGWGVYLFMAAMLERLSAVQSEVAKALIAGSATILAAVIALVVGKLWEQRLKIRDEIRAKKVPIYEKHIATFFKIFFAPKITGKQPDEKEAVAAFTSFSEQMITWGSTDVIKAWNAFRSLDHSTTSPDEQMAKLEGIFLAIRKDVGNDVRSLEKGELLRLFVNDDPKTTPASPVGKSLK